MLLARGRGTDAPCPGQTVRPPALFLPREFRTLKTSRDYPDFFAKLYSLLEPSLMFVKYRGRFFRLTDDFLQSPCATGRCSADTTFFRGTLTFFIRMPAAGGGGGPCGRPG